MIPKIIHYCWFGRNPLPPLARECIASWRKFFPDYEIKEWNEDNFDVNVIPYTADAYKAGKYAFVSDFARFWIMYNYGGLYFDTDVEVISPMDDIVANGNFMGFEVDPDGHNSPDMYAPRYSYAVSLGLGFGMTERHPFMFKMMDYYKNLQFRIENANDPFCRTIVSYTTECLMLEGLCNRKGIQIINDITVYPTEFFAPIDVVTGKLRITPDTRTVHHYMGSWNPGNPSSLKTRMKSLVPDSILYLINKIKRNHYKIK